jgi:U3 small nucleolar RNA-associated protein 4
VLDDEDEEVHLPPLKKQKIKSVNNNNFTICLRYSNILFQDFVNEKEMVVVEEPWRSVLEELPAALARRVYGT